MKALPKVITVAIKPKNLHYICGYIYDGPKLPEDYVCQVDIQRKTLNRYMKSKKISIIQLTATEQEISENEISCFVFITESNEMVPDEIAESIPLSLMESDGDLPCE